MSHLTVALIIGFAFRHVTSNYTVPSLQSSMAHLAFDWGIWCSRRSTFDSVTWFFLSVTTASDTKTFILSNVLAGIGLFLAAYDVALLHKR